MTIAGEGRAPARSHLLRVAAQAGLASREADSIIDRVAEMAAGWRRYFDAAGVGKRTTRMVGKAIEQCLARL